MACHPGWHLTAQPRSSEMQNLVILTTSAVYDSIVLGDYESGVTYPTVLPDPIPTTARGSTKFVYQLGPEPGLRHRIVTS